MWLAAPVV